jgi:Na+/citrate or Na+/malate symporter
MTDIVQVAVIGAVATVVVALINNKIGKVDKKVNGRMDELLELTRKSSHAEGDKKGREDLKQEQIDDNKT